MGLIGVSDLYQPETAKSAELGFKSSLDDNRLQINGSMFDTRDRNQLYFVFVGALGAQVLTNIDKVDLRGYELDAKFRVLDDLTVYGAYRVRSDGCFLTASYSRNKHHPWGLQGGREGSSNYVRVIRANGETRDFAVVTSLEVNRDDVIRIVTANGGGYGDPAKRSREAIVSDLKNGYLDARRAADVYGYRHEAG